MFYKTNYIVAILLAAEILSGAVQIGVARGEGKWGYAGNHNALIRTVPGAGKLELTAEFEAPPVGKDSPVPRESWFGIYLDDSVQHTRYVWALFNPSWDAAPETMAPTLIHYEKNGNMQRKSAESPFPLGGKLVLTLTLEKGKLRLLGGTSGETPRLLLECSVPEGFVPDRAGVTVDCYGAQPVTPIRFDSFTLVCDGEPTCYQFTEAEKWQTTSPRGLLSYLGTPPVAAGLPAVPGPVVVTAAGIRSDGLAEVGGALQKLLDSGCRELSFPRGIYPVESLKLPGGASLRFASGAILKITGAIELAGDDITVEGACFEYDITRPGKLITAANRSNLRFLSCSTVTWKGSVAGKEPYAKEAPTLFALTGCRDVLLADGRFADLGHVLHAVHTAGVTVRGNAAERCATLTTVADGSEFLNHTGNWSRNVRYQCMWWGGDSNDTKKNVTPNSARTVKRNFAPGVPEFDRDTSGTYDISVQNNFAEHGTTLAWGSKGRNILISGNIARYMDDMAYDTEGGENVVIANNISVNSLCAGIGCYFYGERVLITGNQVLIFEEGEEKQRGNFIRLHSAGKSDHFGNGQILITGNQFIAETVRERNISIETAREVFIKGNTFRNGRIAAVNGHAERITIADNDFENLLPKALPAIELAGGIGHTIRDNRFRRHGGEGVALKLSGDAARFYVSNNLFVGYPALYELSDTARGVFFFTGNEYDGGRTGSANGWRVVEHGNISYEQETR